MNYYFTYPEILKLRINQRGWCDGGIKHACPAPTEPQSITPGNIISSIRPGSPSPLAHMDITQITQNSQSAQSSQSAKLNKCAAQRRYRKKEGQGFLQLRQALKEVSKDPRSKQDTLRRGMSVPLPPPFMISVAPHFSFQRA